MKVFSGLISSLFIPLVMPVLALLFAMFVPAELDYSSFNSLYYLDDQSKFYFLYSFTVFGLVAPGVSILILRTARVIKTISLETAKERFVPLFLTAAYSTMLLVLLTNLEKEIFISKHIIALAISGLCLSFLYGVINYWTKVSLHAGGVGMLVGFALAYSFDQSLLTSWPLYAVVFLAGLILMARIYLGKHTPQQAYLGFIVGSFITFSIDYLCILYWT